MGAPSSPIERTDRRLQNPGVLGASLSRLLLSPVSPEAGGGRCRIHRSDPRNE